MTSIDRAAIERYCEVMHDAYEAAAVSAGWETQAASRKPWADVPEANKATMRVAVAAAVNAVQADLADCERALREITQLRGYGVKGTVHDAIDIARAALVRGQ